MEALTERRKTELAIYEIKLKDWGRREEIALSIEAQLFVTKRGRWPFNF